jgi:hypothetical protein
MGASGTTTPRLKIETLNRFENGPMIPALGQNFPFCACDMLLVMISSLYYDENVLLLIDLSTRRTRDYTHPNNFFFSHDFIHTNLYLVLGKN